MRYWSFIFFSFVFLLIPESGKTCAQDFGRRERTYDVQHLKIEVQFDEPKKKVIGKVTATISPMRPSFDSFWIDAMEMTIKKVTLQEGTSLSFEYDSARLTIHLDKRYGAGSRITYMVEYECTPRKGLYFIQPNESFPSDPMQIWTQGQGEDNRFWIPCYDYPNDKSTTEIIMTVRDSYVTLSNGFLKNVRENTSEKTKTWHWVQDKPHSSYLIMLAAGDYEIYRDTYGKIPVESYHYKTDLPDDVKRTYRTTAEMVKFFSKKIGVEYPWAKYAQISVAYFIYGGMENTTATVMNDQRMVVDARAALDYSPDGLIAHELAHQWWGDYLTYIDWQNAWLNEGFATFFQQVWTQHKWGEDDYRYQRFGAIEGYIHWAKSVGRIPIVTNKPNGGQNIYGKGAEVLHMLRTILGEELFWKSIKAYAEKFALKSVETHDFKRTIEDVTGNNLYWFFDQWVHKAGYPELIVTDRWEGTKKKLTVTVEQVQKHDSVCGYFRLPVDIQIVTPTSKKIVHVTADSATSNFEFDVEEKPLLVSFDHGSNLCAQIDHRKSTQDMIYQLLNDEDLVQRIRAGRALIERASEPGVLDALHRSIQTDQYAGVRHQLLQRCTELNVDSISFNDRLKEIFLTGVADAKSNIRATALGGLRKFKDANLRPVFEKARGDSSYYVVAGSLQCLTDLDSIKAAPMLKQSLNYPSYRDVVAITAIDLLAQLGDKTAISDIREKAMPGGSMMLRNSAITALGRLGEGSEDVWNFLNERLQEPSPRIQEMLLRAIVKIKHENTPALLERMLQSSTNEKIISLIKSLRDKK